MNQIDIRLRAVEPEDWEYLFYAESDPSTEEYSNQTAPLSKDLLKRYALTYDADPFHSGQLRLIIETTDGRPVGIADLFDISPRHSRAECGIYISPLWRGKHMATEALKYMKRFASSSLGLAQLTATISKENTSALAAFQSAGFGITGFRPKWWRNSSGFHDVMILNTMLD